VSNFYVRVNSYSGEGGFWRSLGPGLQGGIRKVSVHKKRVSERTLFKPDDLFYPLKKYRRLFGDPTHPRNKASKHVVCIMNGVRGSSFSHSRPDQSKSYIQLENVLICLRPLAEDAAPDVDLTLTWRSTSKSGFKFRYLDLIRPMFRKATSALLRGHR
jgi:hypothetical protein